MTRRHLRWLLFAVLTAFGVTFAIAVYLRAPFAEAESSYYRTFKDVMPTMIAVPAAYLAFAFQRRNSYLQALRTLWSHMVHAVAAAMAYTDLDAPTKAEYQAVLMKLGVAIEEVRAVFKNVPKAGDADGLYPFEPVKRIYQEIRALGHGDGSSAADRLAARSRIYNMWKDSRSRLLAEFDRDTPTHHHVRTDAGGTPLEDSEGTW
jgi:hypothetical protein